MCKVLMNNDLRLRDVVAISAATLGGSIEGFFWPRLKASKISKIRLDDASWEASFRKAKNPSSLPSILVSAVKQWNG